MCVIRLEIPRCPLTHPPPIALGPNILSYTRLSPSTHSLSHALPTARQAVVLWRLESGTLVNLVSISGRCERGEFRFLGIRNEVAMGFVLERQNVCNVATMGSFALIKLSCYNT